MDVLKMTKRSLGVVKHVLGLHYRRSRVVKLMVELHLGCFNSNQKESWSGEVNDRVLPQES